MLIDLNALNVTPKSSDPFDHMVVPNFVPPGILGHVVADLPETMPGGSLPPSALRLGPAARTLIEELEGRPLRDAIAERFDLDLSEAPTMLTVRGVSRERDGHIHRDSTSKLVTALLYLNPANAAWLEQGGSLRLLRSSSDLDDYAVEVPPTDGTLLVFPNGPTTWHGHRRFLGRRYAMQLNYMRRDGAARSELRRHRISAFLKRFARAS